MKKTQSLPSISKQSGNAAILFALLIPVLFGIFILASDGARALQSKVRLEDALEAASLAVSAADVDKDNKRKKIAKAYIKQYMTDMDSIKTISAVASEDVNAGNYATTKYTVTATTKHKSWFPGNDTIQGFGETFSVSGVSVARKYHSEAIDVVFAADFSGSMRRGWSGGTKAKYLDLIDIITEVTEILDDYNSKNREKSMAAFVPFDEHTVNKIIPHEKKLFDGHIGIWREWHYVDQIETTGILGTDILKIFIDYPETINNLFTEKKDKTWAQDFNIADDGRKHNGYFYTLPLTSNFKEFNNTINSTINPFSPGGATASYQGIIRSAQVAIDGHNSRRLIIVLSDGSDSIDGIIDNNIIIKNEAVITKELVNRGMCDKIRETLNNDTNKDTPKVTSKIVIIGFDYEPKANGDLTGSLQQCTGKKNVFKAESKKDIKRTILALISEEIGRLS